MANGGVNLQGKRQGALSKMKEAPQCTVKELYLGRYEEVAAEWKNRFLNEQPQHRKTSKQARVDRETVCAFRQKLA